MQRGNNTPRLFFLHQPRVYTLGRYPDRFIRTNRFFLTLGSLGSESSANRPFFARKPRHTVYFVRAYHFFCYTQSPRGTWTPTEWLKCTPTGCRLRSSLLGVLRGLSRNSPPKPMPKKSKSGRKPHNYFSGANMLTRNSLEQFRAQNKKK